MRSKRRNPYELDFGDPTTEHELLEEGEHRFTDNELFLLFLLVDSGRSAWKEGLMYASMPVPIGRVSPSMAQVSQDVEAMMYWGELPSGLPADIPERGWAVCFSEGRLAHNWRRPIDAKPVALGPATYHLHMHSSMRVECEIRRGVLSILDDAVETDIVNSIISTAIFRTSKDLVYAIRAGKKALETYTKTNGELISIASSLGSSVESKRYIGMPAAIQRYRSMGGVWRFNSPSSDNIKFRIKQGRGTLRISDLRSVIPGWW